jgi:sulfate adenylyltransferase
MLGRPPRTPPSPVPRVNPPYGGALIDPMAGPDRARELRNASRDWPSLDLSPSQLDDLELMLNGALSPLAGYLRQDDYESVLASSRLRDGRLWPVPQVLAVPADLARKLKPGDALALRDPEGVALAVLRVDELWQPDLERESRLLGLNPAVSRAVRPGSLYAGGRVEGLQLPPRYDFRDLRHSPADLRRRIQTLGWTRIASLETADVLHLPDRELARRRCRELGAGLLLQALTGVGEDGAPPLHPRIRCIRALFADVPAGEAMISLLTPHSRDAQSRRLLRRMILAKNQGCTDVLLPAMAGGRDSASHKPWEEELGVAVSWLDEGAYLEDRATYIPRTSPESDGAALYVSRAQIRALLEEGRPLPSWLTPAAVAAELAHAVPPRCRQGFTVFFTGLSGAGKSTVAQILWTKLLERNERPVTLLDGDLVRKHLSSELGFSKEHRDLNIRRIGFVASEITRAGGVAICSPIAPYDSVRREVRSMVAPVGGFCLVYMATPLNVCETRDRKGLYAKARAGLVQAFTGISDPYEIPTDAELTIDTTNVMAEDAADRILRFLAGKGYLSGERRP